MRGSVMRAALARAVVLLFCAGAMASAVAQTPAVQQRSIVDLQTSRQGSSLALPSGGDATLINLNPAIGAWYVLSLRRGASARVYHLESMDATPPRLYPQGLLLGADAVPCPLWSGTEPAVDPLDAAWRTGLPYAPLCGGRLYLRSAAIGAYTRLERVTGFLRDHVWGGEMIVDFVRDRFYHDAFLETATPASVAAVPSVLEGPRPARLVPDAAAAVATTDLGIDLGEGIASVDLGRWYPVHQLPGVYLSAVQARATNPEVLERYRGRIDLDETEGAALNYLVAFDLRQFDLRFALGTDHPRLGWSERVLDEARVPGLAGPDGIDSDAPLARTGMVNPALIPRVVATFTGGFKREHGAFHYGALARVNHGSHYGFLEEGVVFSALQPGLSTLYVRDDGVVDMKSWGADDDSLLPRLRYARQNGVALVEPDRDSGMPQPGSMVTQWGPGNWSGSKDEEFRTLRAGVCIAGAAPGYLIYGYFSAATPRAMARVFQAYGCRYAMHLDMNALEHTYLALYARDNGRLLVQHLIQGMAEVDRKGAVQAPRFLGFPDDRDFFYLLRRGGNP